MDTIIAEISCENIVEGVVNNSVDLNAIISTTDTIAGDVYIPIFANYEGRYKVIPKPNESQTLETANKVMANNITVTEIPYYEVSNKTGNTVYIGKEIKTNGD